LTATDSTAEPPAEAFYDARRDVHYTKPALRGWLHLLWFEVSLVGGTLLLARAHGATPITGSAIYAASVSAMFGASALYHCGSWSATWRQRLQRLDHAMIFFLIAGTATPAFLLAVRGTLGLVCLIMIWALTATAAAVRMTRMSTPELIAGAMFVGLGWLVLRCHGCGPTPAWRPHCCCLPVACCTQPAPCHIAAAGPTPSHQYSAITRSSTPSYAPPRHASSSRSRCSSPEPP